MRLSPAGPITYLLVQIIGGLRGLAKTFSCNVYNHCDLFLHHCSDFRKYHTYITPEKWATLLL